MGNSRCDLCGNSVQSAYYYIEIRWFFMSIGPEGYYFVLIHNNIYFFAYHLCAFNAVGVKCYFFPQIAGKVQPFLL